LQWQLRGIQRLVFVAMAAARDSSAGVRCSGSCAGFSGWCSLQWQLRGIKRLLTCGLLYSSLAGGSLTLAAY
jgi:hypothetical protein